MSFELGNLGNLTKYSNKDIAEAIIAFNPEIPWTDRFERLMHEWSACQRPQSYWRNFISYLINNNNDEQINKYLTTINSSFLKNCEDIYHLCVEASYQVVNKNDQNLLKQLNRSDVLKSLIFDGNNVSIDFNKIQIILTNKFPCSTKYHQIQMAMKLETEIQFEFFNVFNLMQNDFPYASQTTIKEIAYNTLQLDNYQTTSSAANTSKICNNYSTNDLSTKQQWPQQNYPTNYNNQYPTNYGNIGFAHHTENPQQHGYVTASTSSVLEME